MIFFFNDTATTEIYTLSLHDALPIYLRQRRAGAGRDHELGGLVEGDSGEPRRRQGRLGLRRPPDRRLGAGARDPERRAVRRRDRERTRLNSRHAKKLDAAFFLKKKKT